MVYYTEERINENNVLKFEIDMNKLINENEDIIIDMINTHYINSSAFRVIIMSLKTLRAKHKKLSVINIQPLVKEVFEVTGMSELINDNNIEKGISRR